MPVPITEDGIRIDLSARVQETVAVAGSPATNEEKIIATLTLNRFSDMPIVSGIDLSGWAAFTIGTSGTAITMRLRQTNASGNVVASTGAITGGVAAAALFAQDVEGFDAAPGIGVYVLTLQVTGGAAISTVTAVKLRGIVV